MYHQWQDCGVVLNAQIPRVDLLVRNQSLTWMSCALSRRKSRKADGCGTQICGGYFDLEDIKDILFQVENPELRLIKVRWCPY